MILTFSTKAKVLKKAYETQKLSVLDKDWSNRSKSIMSALGVLKSADHLNALAQFKHLRPHALNKDGKSKYCVYSITPVGRVRITLVSQDVAGNKLKDLDYASTYAHILEVSEHYGD